jgi:hypothetical protein
MVLRFTLLLRAWFSMGDIPTMTKTATCGSGCEITEKFWVG